MLLLGSISSAYAQGKRRKAEAGELLRGADSVGDRAASVELLGSHA